MANTTDPRIGLQAFLQRAIGPRIRNTLFPIMPTLEFLFALIGDKEGSYDLGRPRTSIVLSSFATAKARKQKIMAERSYSPTIQTSAPSESDIKTMQLYDNDPTVADWEDNSILNTFTQPVFKFCKKKMPYQVNHADIRTAKANATEAGQTAAAIKSVYLAETKTRMAVLQGNWNKYLMGTLGTGSPADETQVYWSAIHSLQQAFGNANLYAGIDRTVSGNSWWQGNYITTADSNTFAARLDYLNYDLGLASKGGGIQMVAVGATQFKKAKAEAKTESYQMFTQGIPEFPEFGFKREVIKINTGNRPVYIYYEPGLPANHGAFMDPDTFTIAIPEDGNFFISTPSDQTKVKGGDEADIGTINSEILWACEVPSFNAYYTDLL